jgi:hypothetical protein
MDHSGFYTSKIYFVEAMRVLFSGQFAPQDILSFSIFFNINFLSFLYF